MAEQTRIIITAKEFEALPEMMGLVELIEGKFVHRVSETPLHQHHVGQIAMTLHEMIPNGDIFLVRTSVKLNDQNYYQPDVLSVSENNPGCEVGDGGINGAPDLVVEVISVGTAKMDRGIKFEMYQVAGVREYWIIEPEEDFVEVWHLQDTSYIKVGLFATGSRFTSPTLNQEIAVLDLLQP